MPTVFTQNGFRFFFYSNEGNPREPIHIHVRKGGAEAKIWLYPIPKVTRNSGFDGKTLRFLLNLTQEKSDEITHVWHTYFG